MTPTLWQGPLAWDDATIPQPGAAGRSVFWPHGRTLGGSSSINGMVYVRGNRVDYDTWRDVHGCHRWGYADLLPYFRRAEDQQRGESVYHGVGGPLRVEDPRYIHPLSEAWVGAAIADGFAGNDDFNGATQDGAGLYQVTQRGGRRWSTADGYLRPALERGNLMPAVPRGNTNAPAIAVAERAADLIRGGTPLAPADLEAEPATVGAS